MQRRERADSLGTALDKVHTPLAPLLDLFLGSSRCACSGVFKERRVGHLTWPAFWGTLEVFRAYFIAVFAEIVIQSYKTL